MLKDRILLAQGLLDKHDVDALLLVDLCNIRYLSGFTGSAGILIVGRNEGFFLTDSRYTTQASAEVKNFSIREYRSQLDGIIALFKEKAASRVGIEAGKMTVGFYNDLSESLPDIKLVPLLQDVERLRLKKCPDELHTMASSAEIASNAMMKILGQIKPGAIERDLALSLEFAMKNSGADEKAFDFIVASGVRGALPHGKASGKTINSGELVTFDFGAVYEGYFSDETITVSVGTPDGRQTEIYSIVKEAHDRALAAVKPGISLRELDALARDYISAHGYGEFFGHGLGHGVGLEVHEQPVVSFRGEGLVEEGMVFTIEPGIYIPGWGGVRIEDTVAVTAEGYELLTKVPKDLIVLN